VIQEAIAHIEEQTRHALGVEVVHIPGQPAHVVYVRVGAELQRIVLDPAPRVIELETIADLIGLAKAHFDQDVREDGKMAVFYTDEQVVLIFNTSDGLETAWVRLIASEEYRFVRKQATEPTISVQDLRAALRYILRECQSPDAIGLLAKQVSAVVFSTQDTGSINLDRKGESMGASIARQIENVAGLPDELQTFQIRRFANPDLTGRYQLTCILDPDHANRRFILKPTQSAILDLDHAAVKDVGQILHTGLDAARIPVFQGRFRVDSGHPAQAPQARK
jgi:hypothetical protein